MAEQLEQTIIDEINGHFTFQIGLDHEFLFNTSTDDLIGNLDLSLSNIVVDQSNGLLYNGINSYVYFSDLYLKQNGTISMWVYKFNQSSNTNMLFTATSENCFIGIYLYGGV